MELSQHANIIKKYKVFIIIFALFVAGASFLFAYNKPTTYKAVVSFDVNLINRPVTQDYQYGSYYDLKGAEIFTQNAMSWLKTPSVIEEIYQDAEVGYEIKNLDQFTNHFKTRQYGAQTFVVTFFDPSLENGHKIAASVGKIVSQKAEQSNQDTEKRSLFKIKASEPVVVESSSNIYLITILGLVVGLVAGIILIYLKHYINSSK